MKKVVDVVQLKTSVFTYFEACDFEDFPIGGTLSFAKHILASFPGEVRLIGFSGKNEPVGKWFCKIIDGHSYEYYGICSVEEINSTIFPKRLFSFWALRRHIRKITNQKRIDYVFTQSPQFVFVLSHYNWKSFCFCFAGLGNSVALSKYRFLRIFGRVYERFLFHTLKDSSNCILAAASANDIQEKTIKYKLDYNAITQFPTRFDDKVFKVKDPKKCKKYLDLEGYDFVLLSVGRVSYIKGWKLIVDAYRLAKNRLGNTLLVFIGDGEDMTQLQNYCKKDLDEKSILIKGFLGSDLISCYLNASNVFLSGSLVEGWPTTMVEALACGIPIVSTEVSGSEVMIENGLNGYVVKGRDPKVFSNYIIQSTSLERPNKISLKKSKKYSQSSLRNNFSELWIDE